MKSTINPQGFDWRVGATYIVMNKHLTSKIGDLWKVLPYRRKLKGKEPGMAGEAMTSKKVNIEDQWVFKSREVNREQLM